mmetsp:Transcript_14063/g.50498  ORF Transcript_14063/g.50498 Transcript_14063/m.50498 type:complete len:489 (+) Transcript_14063:671-2137(+)
MASQMIRLLYFREAKLVLRIMRGLRRKASIQLLENSPADNQKLIWIEEQNRTSERNDGRACLPAPKVKLPTNIDSYNPPPEYDCAEVVKSIGHSVVQKIDLGSQVALRAVPSYSDFVTERFQRCLDLYLCPRVLRTRLNFQQSDILPSLPTTKELKPFPSLQSLTFFGHSDKVLSVAVHISGQWLISGSADSILRMWEVSTGRCIRSWQLAESASCVAWSSHDGKNIVSVCVGCSLVLLNTQKECSRDNMILNERVSNDMPSWEERKNDIVFVHHIAPVERVSWHHKGDYFATLVPKGNNILVHSLSRRTTRPVFQQQNVPIQRAVFHVSRPWLIVSTRSKVYLYDLHRQFLVKKMSSGSSISCIATHFGGDNIIVGCSNGRLAWFDMDFSDTPYRVLASHHSTVKSVAFHRRYPLFASVSDDTTAQIFYGLVYSEIEKNALIVPVKVLRSHALKDCEGILDCDFHPAQPWLFTAGADCTIVCFCDGV